MNTSNLSQDMKSASDETNLDIPNYHSNSSEFIKVENLSRVFSKFYKKTSVTLSLEELDSIHLELDNFFNDFLDIYDRNVVREGETNDSLQNNQDLKELKNFIALSKFSDTEFNIIHIVAKFGNQKQLKFIINFCGLEYINVTDLNLFTPLHHAAFNGNLGNVQLLLDFGANKLARTSIETKQWLPIHYAAKNGFKDVVEEFINFGVDKEDPTGFGLSSLHVACENGNIEVAEYLLKIGSNKNAVTIIENYELTPLHFASLGNYAELVEILLKAGADREKTDSSGRNALDLAILNNALEAAEILLIWGLVSSEKILKDYNEAINQLFEFTKLIKVSQILAKQISEFNSNNLFEARVVIFGGVLQFNAYGICAIKKKIGWLKKYEIDLQRFAEMRGIYELNNALKNLKVLIAQRDRF